MVCCISLPLQTYHNMKKILFIGVVLICSSFQQQPTKEVNIRINVDEVNQVLDALAQKPYKDVYAVMGKIISQVEKQLTDTTKKK